MVIGLLASAIAVLLAAFALLLDVRAKANETQVDAMQSQVGSVTFGLAKTVAHVNTVIDSWDKTQAEDAQQVRGVLHEARQTLLESHRAAAKVNTDLIPAAIATVKDANAVTLDLDTTVKSSNVAVNTLTADAVKFGKTLDATNAIVADPNIPSALAAINKGAQNFVTMTNDGTVILDDGRKTADYYYAKLTAPLTLAQKIGHAAASYGAQAWGAWLGAGARIP